MTETGTFKFTPTFFTLRMCGKLIFNASSGFKFSKLRKVCSAVLRCV